MKKFYDKILLLVALLALVVGGVYYILNASYSVEVVEPSPSGDSYRATEFDPSIEFEGNWPRPEPQSSTWIYDVFTPPKIYIDPNTGLFSIEPIDPDSDEEVPFGIYLTKLERDLYRFQFEGYVETDADNPSASIIYVFDTEESRQISARKGNVYEDSGFEILDFTIRRQTDDTGGISRVATVVLRDLREDEEITIRQGEIIFEDSLTIGFASNQHPEFSAEVQNIGDSFENPSGRFTIENISLENQTVTVEKVIAGEEAEPERRILSLRSGSLPDTEPSEDPSSTEDSTSSPSTTDSDGTFFDDLF